MVKRSGEIEASLHVVGLVGKHRLEGLDGCGEIALLVGFHSALEGALGIFLGLLSSAQHEENGREERGGLYGSGACRRDQI